MPEKTLYWICIISIILNVSCREKVQKTRPPENEKLTQEKLIEANRILIKKDQLRIKGYIKRKGWNMTETGTGLWYEIIQQGKGKQAKDGMVATINYTLSIMDGDVCYSSATSGPKIFLIGKGNVESGLEQGILLLNEGATARLILPPYLAYGLPGDGEKIPARAILVYNIELTSLTNP